MNDSREHIASAKDQPLSPPGNEKRERNRFLFVGPFTSRATVASSSFIETVQKEKRALHTSHKSPAKVFNILQHHKRFLREIFYFCLLFFFHRRRSSCWFDLFIKSQHVLQDLLRRRFRFVTLVHHDSGNFPNCFVIFFNFFFFFFVNPRRHFSTG